MDASPIDPRVEQFRHDSGKWKNIVVCVQCGSTCIDQNTRNQIKCYSCGNVSIWDADRFTIARDADEHDAVRGFQRVDSPRPDQPGEWHAPIVSSLMPLMHKLPDMPSVYSGSQLPKIQREDFQELLNLWKDAKIKIDAVIESIVRRDDSIEG